MRRSWDTGTEARRLIGALPTADVRLVRGVRPDPDLSGNLRVDPEIHLPSVAWMWISLTIIRQHGHQRPFGYGRTISTN